MSNKNRPPGRPAKYPPEFQADAVAMVLDEERSIADDACSIGQATGPTKREVVEAELVVLIREIFEATEGNDGVPRMHHELRDNGIVVNIKRVRRLMRLHGMAGWIRRRVRTTIAGADGYTMPGLVGRAFTPGRPDVAWCHDIERHEALLNLAVVKGHGHQFVAAEKGRPSHEYRSPARSRSRRHECPHLDLTPDPGEVLVFLDHPARHPPSS